MPTTPATVKDRVQHKIDVALPQLEPSEKALMDVLIGNWGDGMRISQREIAGHSKWLPLHQDYVSDVQDREFETACRVVREEVRNLRVRHKIPVLADGAGYFLPNDQAEVDAYLKRMESEAKARAAASMVTYHAMRDALGVQSDFFESMAPVVDDQNPVPVKNASGETVALVEVHHTKPKTSVSSEKKEPNEYIWAVLQEVFASKFHKYSKAIQWEKVPDSGLRWRIVFDKAPDKKDKCEIRIQLGIMGFGSPEFSQITGGKFVLPILCTEYHVKEAFKWRRRQAATEAKQKLLWANIQVISNKLGIDLSKAEWRPSVTQPNSNYVLEFPKDIDCSRIGEVFLRKINGHGLDKGVLVERGCPNKLIFVLAEFK